MNGTYQENEEMRILTEHADETIDGPMEPDSPYAPVSPEPVSAPEEEVDAEHTHLAATTLSKMPIVSALRDYQREGAERIVALFLSGVLSTVLVGMCGIGKTLISSTIATMMLKIRARRVLVITPSADVSHQWASCFRQNYTQNTRLLQYDRVHVIASRSPVPTSSATEAGFRIVVKNTKKLYRFSTEFWPENLRHTGVYISNVDYVRAHLAELQNEFELVIYDEVHHVSTKRAKLLSTLAPTYILGASATPVRTDKGKLFPASHLPSRTVKPISVKSAIERGFISAPHLMLVDLKWINSSPIVINYKKKTYRLISSATHHCTAEIASFIGTGESGTYKLTVIGKGGSERALAPDTQSFIDALKNYFRRQLSIVLWLVEASVKDHMARNIADSETKDPFETKFFCASRMKTSGNRAGTTLPSDDDEEDRFAPNAQEGEEVIFTNEIYTMLGRLTGDGTRIGRDYGQDRRRFSDLGDSLDILVATRRHREAADNRRVGSVMLSSMLNSLIDAIQTMMRASRPDGTFDIAYCYVLALEYRIPSTIDKNPNNFRTQMDTFFDDYTPAVSSITHTTNNMLEADDTSAPQPQAIETRDTEEVDFSDDEGAEDGDAQDGSTPAQQPASSSSGSSSSSDGVPPPEPRLNECDGGARDCAMDDRENNITEISVVGTKKRRAETMPEDEFGDDDDDYLSEGGGVAVQEETHNEAYESYDSQMLSVVETCGTLPIPGRIILSPVSEKTGPVNLRRIFSSNHNPDCLGDFTGSLWAFQKSTKVDIGDYIMLKTNVKFPSIDFGENKVTNTTAIYARVAKVVDTDEGHRETLFGCAPASQHSQRCKDPSCITREKYKKYLSDSKRANPTKASKFVASLKAQDYDHDELVLLFANAGYQQPEKILRSSVDPEGTYGLPNGWISCDEQEGEEPLYLLSQELEDMIKLGEARSPACKHTKNKRGKVARFFDRLVLLDDVRLISNTSSAQLNYYGGHKGLDNIQGTRRITNPDKMKGFHQWAMHVSKPIAFSQLISSSS